MDVQDGLTVGIFDYCDRWRERCALTSRCRVFTDAAQLEAIRDPGVEPLVHAPPLPSRTAPVRPRWMREIIVQPMAADLVWLGGALDRVIPNARAFAPPAVGEPDVVAMMLAAEGWSR